jgi:NADH-dependent peroxiredoxin subunit C
MTVIGYAFYSTFALTEKDKLMLKKILLLALLPAIVFAEELPAPVKAIEKQGITIIKTFDAPGGMKGYLGKYQDMGVDVYAVSTDTHFTHKAWHSSSETIAKIKYAMIGDPTGALTRNFDNMREDEGLADRATFVVDPQGIIQAIEVTAEGIGRDASDLLRKIKAAQYVASHPGEVCPAKWKEGEATLAPSLDLVGKI